MSARPEPERPSAGAAAREKRRYSAFISYTDSDRARALRLQARLERYRLPLRLAQRLGFTRIAPVFVDRAEMRAAPDLGDAIRDALARSDFLIVLCTPRTPASHWVGCEIDMFRELRGGGNILVALFEGEKAACFHPRLLGRSADDDQQPLAADFRPRGDGYRLALLKLMAALVGADLDDLVHRDGKRSRNRLLTVGGGALALALVIAGLSLTAYRASIAVDEGRIVASRAMERQLDDLRAKIKAGGTLDMAAAVNRSVELFYDDMPPGSQLPEVELGRAKLLQAKTDDDRQRGDLRAAASDARSAWDVSSRVLAGQPDNPKAIFVHAQSAYWVGYVAWLRRDTPLAANAFARYADLADRLVKVEPANPDYRLEQGYAYSNLGTIALREARDANRALRYFSAAQDAFHEVANSRPGDPDPLYELTDGEAWLSDVELFRGDFAAAKRHRDAQSKLVVELLKLDPQDRRFQDDRVTSRLGQARLYAAQGNYERALSELRLAQGEAEQLSVADPTNAVMGRQLRAIELFRAESELGRAGGPELAAARKLIGDCSADWADHPDNELPAFCSLLAARVALERGDKAAARRIMGDPRLAPWLRSPSLSPTWRLDFPAECRKLGDPGLCR